VILLLRGVLIAADMALGATLEFASAQAEQQELALMMRNRDLLKRTSSAPAKSRATFPQFREDCDAFEQSLSRKHCIFRDQRGNGLAGGQSGLHLDAVAFKPKLVRP